MPEAAKNPRGAGAGPDSRTGEAMRAALGRQLAEPGMGRVACAPPAIPDHTLLRCIGHGAYGDVWLARNALGTLRAVKVVYRARFQEDRPYEREFHGILKYEPVSRTHEGLVQVLHVGRDEGRGCFYYVMELADAAREPAGAPGARRPAAAPASSAASSAASPPPDAWVADYSPRTLHSDLARHQRLPPRDAAQFVLRLARTLAHLHASGLVHRDVKPSNVIFVGGQPKLADIGLVTDLGSSQSFVGTEGFIPPEGPGTPQADIYGLGKLLYELATGRDRMDFPQLPPGLSRWPDGEALLELNEVMTRACAPDPGRRYAGATDLQADLNLFLAGRSLRQARTIERALARLQRFAVAACLFLALAVGALLFVRNEERHANERARQATERARVEALLRARAEAAERQTEQQLHAALIEQARATILGGELGHRFRTLDAVRRAGAISNSAALRGVAMAALALPDARLEREWPTTPDMTLVNLDPAFGRIAVCRGSGPVEIRSVADQGLLARLPASTNKLAYSSAWSPDGRFFAVARDLDRAGQEKDLEVWKLPEAERVLLLRAVPRGILSFHPRQPRILVSRRSPRVSVLDLASGRELASHPLAGEASVLRFAPDGESFAAAHPLGEGWQVAVHRTEDGRPCGSHVFTNRVTELAWHPGGRWLAVPDRAGGVQLMDAETGETRVLGRHKGDAVVAEFSPDGRYLFTGGWDRELICWDVGSMQRAFAFGLDSYRFQMRSDGRQCAVIRWPEVRVQLHAFEPPALRREFPEDLGGPRNSAAFSPDGRWLAASGAEKFVVWDLAGDGSGTAREGGVEVPLAFAASGELFAQQRGVCARWRVSPGTNAMAPPVLQPLELASPPGLVSFCLLSHGVVFTGSRGSCVTAWERLAHPAGSWARTADGLGGASPDERWLAMFRPYSPHLYIHRLPGFELVAKLTNQMPIGRFEFSPKGDEVAVFSRGGVEFWSTITWQRTRHWTNFTTVRHSPDGQTAWLTTQRRTAGLYDARSTELLLPLPPETVPLALSPDQRRLAVAVSARRVQVWDLAEVRKQLRALGLDWVDVGHR